MTQPGEPPPPPHDLNYQTVRPESSAATLVLLAFIFNYSAGGLEMLYALFRILSIFITSAMFIIPKPAGTAPAFSFAGPAVMIAVDVAMFILSLGAGVLKVAAAEGLRRRTHWAWPTALAAGIVGCVEIWCSCCMVITLAAGVYTIVILCLESVRTYLQQRPPQTGFPVIPPNP
jgi:hypothetical protein